MLHGMQDSIEDDPHAGITDVFELTNSDIAQFPELEGYNEVRLSYSDQGFVYVEVR
jgi:hypothetical protein